jgi:5-deoxy-5-amino-3-dehydroquinate synthase
VQHHYDVVAGAYELDTALPAGLDPDELVALMGRDKKAVDSLTFILDGARGVEIVKDVDPVAARQALEMMR